MVDDTNKDRQPSPAPLAYETPGDLGPSVIVGWPPPVVGSLLIGVSLGGVLALGALIFLSINGFDDRPGPRHPTPAADRVAGCLYIFGFVVVGWAAFKLKRKLTPRTRVGRWLLLWLLIGLGIGCLIEGVCFMAV